MSSLMTPTIPTYVERTELPRVLVKAKGGMVRYHAYVNGYIAGAKVRVRGMQVTPIYYLSLVDMAGDGGKLQGIYAALVSEPPQDVYLETVGTIALSHRDPGFESLGYTIHWNYTQGSTADRDSNLHAVIESNMLTMVDPVLGSAPKVRERKHAKKEAVHAKQHGRKARAPGKVMLTTATKKDLGDQEEQVNRARHPLFLLMLPGNVPPVLLSREADETYAARREREVSTYLAEQYFAFLDLRAPQPMSIEWAPFLWQRALVAQENTRLTVWFKQVAQRRDEGEEEQGGEEESPSHSIPLFCDAWLCRPNIMLLDADLKRALRNGLVSNLSAAEAAADVVGEDTRAVVPA